MKWEKISNDYFPVITAKSFWVQCQSSNALRFLLSAFSFYSNFHFFEEGAFIQIFIFLRREEIPFTCSASISVINLSAPTNVVLLRLDVLLGAWLPNRVLWMWNHDYSSSWSGNHSLQALKQSQTTSFWKWNIWIHFTFQMRGSYRYLCV